MQLHLWQLPQLYDIVMYHTLCDTSRLTQGVVYGSVQESLPILLNAEQISQMHGVTPLLGKNLASIGQETPRQIKDAAKDDGMKNKPNTVTGATSILFSLASTDSTCNGLSCRVFKVGSNVFFRLKHQQQRFPAATFGRCRPLAAAEI